MKKVIVKRWTPDDEILFSEFQKLSPYELSSYSWGIEHNPTKRKGFVSRDVYCQGEYRARSSSSLTEGNGWSFDIKDILSSIREDCGKFLSYIILNQPEFTLYQFDTEKELFLWLSED